MDSMVCRICICKNYGEEVLPVATCKSARMVERSQVPEMPTEVTLEDHGGTQVVAFQERLLISICSGYTIKRDAESQILDWFCTLLTGSALMWWAVSSRLQGVNNCEMVEVYQHSVTLSARD
ncbi:hypothetical protein CONLIGDRAFT_687624 [Coniochaeta ligniaria NRRL 30616]|uniref:Uncharacterized protein n=1 Tax=Coniochaeta ligniaria NRRL 30616 TaxID=1408157 RepID=A0A1J7J4C7_9PEZI|nr:hypothetical protein CONLIGDRAFT_687624 [Coniochaeta ligniaria NRRL 30616]